MHSLNKRCYKEPFFISLCWELKALYTLVHGTRKSNSTCILQCFRGISHFLSLSPFQSFWCVTSMSLSACAFNCPPFAWIFWKDKWLPSYFNADLIDILPFTTGLQQRSDPGKLRVHFLCYVPCPHLLRAALFNSSAPLFNWVLLSSLIWHCPGQQN